MNQTTTTESAAETAAIATTADSQAETAGKSKIAQFFGRIKTWLSGLSFRTGVIVLLLCVPCYIFSFVALGLPWFSLETKGILWTVFFGLAKTFQYGGLTILGKEGIKKLKEKWGRKKKS